MNTKTSLILGASIVIASIVLGVTLRGLATQAPESAAAAHEVGRSQIVGVPGHAFILDTATDRTWEKFVPATSFETSPFHRIVVQQTDPLLGDISDADAVAKILTTKNKSDEVRTKEAPRQTSK